MKVFSFLKKKSGQAKENEEGNSEQKKSKTNCDGCIYQDTCEFGYVNYDGIEYRYLTLWEKYLLTEYKPPLEYEEVINAEHAKLIQHLNRKKEFVEEDALWLNKLILYEIKRGERIKNFSLCADAYLQYTGEPLLYQAKYVLQQIEKYGEFQI
jgi:hypothetical protein